MTTTTITTDPAIVAGLQAASAAGNSFAASLLAGIARYGSLTARQEDAARRLLAQAAGSAPGSEKTALASSVQAVFELLARAQASGLKYPKIRLQAGDGSPIVLALAGARSRHAGEVQVTDGGGFGEGRYFGRIDRAGSLTAARDMTEAVRDAIGRLAADPVGEAARYGRLTGRCCMCNLPLEDERSVAAGFGPVCAERWGLVRPGKKAARAAVTIAGDDDTAPA